MRTGAQGGAKALTNHAAMWLEQLPSLLGADATLTCLAA